MTRRCRATTSGLTLTAVAVLVLPLLVAACTGSSTPRVVGTAKRLTGVTNVTEIAQLTGPSSMNHTDKVEVAGQDLGSMFRMGDRTWFVFGDTFGRRDPGQDGGGGTEWRSNAMAWSTDEDPTDGITFGGYLVDDTNWAKELIPSQKVDGVEMTTIPTYGFAVGDTMYLAFMSVRHWGAPGEWDANFGGLAKSTDHGSTWTVLDSPRWAGDGNFVQLAVAEAEGDLYMWGVHAGRFGGVQLMKVSTKDVERQDAYRYFAGTDQDGSPRWSASPSEAKTVVDGTVGELSVVHNDYVGGWLMSYTDGTGPGARIRSAGTPWGPWGEAATLASAEQVPGLYAPYLSPTHVGNGGRTVYFTLSKWGPYNVFWYSADLVAG